jgi:hypothetical protein
MISGNRLADVAKQWLLRAMTPTETEESLALAWDTAIRGLIEIDAPPHGRPRLGRPAGSGQARDTPRAVARRPGLSEGGETTARASLGHLMREQYKLRETAAFRQQLA